MYIPLFTSKPSDMMPQMWCRLLRILVLLFAFFAMIVFINSEIAKRRKAEAALAALIGQEGAELPGASESEEEPNPGSEEFASIEAKKDIDKLLRTIFVVNDDQGVQIFNGTTPQTQADQVPTTHRQPSDRHGPRPIYPAHSLLGVNDTAALQQCGDAKPESRSFCTQVDNYPDLSGLKMTLSSKFSKFFSDVIPTDLSARVGTEPDDTIYLCRVTPRTIYPKKGLTTNNSWELIVNTDEFKQAIQIEECEIPNGPCEFTDSFPNGYKSYCKQHYVTRNLVSIKDEGPLDPSPESFRIPSCCKCVLKKVN
ncbi:uncharacterized protein Dana_GF22956, isoform K [Drosophila ananassae]|uniref:Uncharacterized protein, isoform K n=1 Tax=Drosophila ananassae TaxID=7217 RepID=A0A0P8XE92_DROAN|nr:protein spaetzle isoform X9 [Drosophila ananassae]KPU72837.1 uncharacterized protein Dana_GF22956, isoform K [Drosophila ananassae]